MLQLGVACGQLASVMVQGWLTVGAEGRRVRGSETGIDWARGRWFRAPRSAELGGAEDERDGQELSRLAR